MRLLHTSDWHLGKSLMAKRRQEEHAAFLAWLLEVLRREEVDILLVAGDIFDTSAPGTAAQQMYYSFLRNVTETPCRHVVIVGGNHDSPSFLNAPRELLKTFSIHVVGCAEGPEKEVLCLRKYAPSFPSSPSGPLSAQFEKGFSDVEAVVCAVPYLRDRDVRSSAPGESLEEKEANTLRGIAEHYAEVARVAREYCAGGAPMIVAGHLFAAGGRVLEGEGVRELAVGSLGAVPPEVFPPDADYVALGHLHSPQRVGGNETRRYSGSPVPLSFAEAGREKSVCLVDFAAPENLPGTSSESSLENSPGTVAPLPGQPSVRLLPVPEFQKIARIEGDLEEVQVALAALVARNESIWVEVVCTGQAVPENLRAQIEEAVAGSTVEVLRVRLENMNAHGLSGQEGEMLCEMREEDVFARCMALRGVPGERQPELAAMFQEVLAAARESLDADEYGQGELAG